MQHQVVLILSFCFASIMALIPGAVEAARLGQLNLLYSHMCLLGDVLLCLSAVAIWMDCLVTFEVCHYCCSGVLLLISSQSEIIQSAGLGDLSNVQLDDWFATLRYRPASALLQLPPGSSVSCPMLQCWDPSSTFTNQWLALLSVCRGALVVH
jgi:hypothetical protein